MQISIDLEKAVVGLREYAKIIGVHPETARRYAREGRIPGAIKVGKRTVVPLSAINQLMSGNTGGSNND